MLSAPTEALRNQLKDILSELDEEIRTAYPASCSELERRTYLAEVSVVKDLVGLVKQALLGEASFVVDRGTSTGNACDLRDSLLICARDCRIEREKREAELAALKSLTWPRMVGDALQRLIDDEERVCDHLSKGSLIDRQRAAALKTVASDLSDVCLKALSDALNLASACQQRRRQIAMEADRLVEAAALKWLSWMEASVREKEEHWANCPGIYIPRVLSEASMHDKQVAAFLGCIRTTMRLRRQQTRLSSIQQRLSSILATQDVVSALRRSILLPPGK